MSNILINLTVIDTKNSIFKSFRTQRAEITEYYCTQKSCPLRDNGKCINVAFLEKCIHGYCTKKQGPTPRSKSYTKFIESGKSHTLYNVLSKPPKKMTIINEYIWLPYAHVDMNKSVPFYEHALYLKSGLPFMKVSDFTALTCLNIITFRPQALMGGEITSYQKEVVPLFLRDLQIEFPIIFNDLIKLDPSIKSRYPLLFDGSFKKFVGKTAILKTCSPFTHSENEWEWTGTVLKFPVKNWILANLNNYNGMIAESIPDDNCTFKITHENQINEKTIFVD